MVMEAGGFKSNKSIIAGGYWRFLLLIQLNLLQYQLTGDAQDFGDLT